MNRMNRKGFTLVELLVVIAVLGTLAVVVLLALNPLQQLARTRDAGRLSTITQVGHALEAYAVNHDSTFPAQSATYLADLVTSSELQNIPTPPAYGLANTSFTCNNGTAQTGSDICYMLTGNNAIVYLAAEGDGNIHKCDAPLGVTAAFGQAWFVYSTADGRAGLVCGGEPTAGAQTFAN